MHRYFFNRSASQQYTSTKHYRFHLSHFLNSYVNFTNPLLLYGCVIISESVIRVQSCLPHLTAILTVERTVILFNIVIIIKENHLRIFIFTDCVTSVCLFKKYRKRNENPLVVQIKHRIFVMDSGLYWY